MLVIVLWSELQWAKAYLSSKKDRAYSSHHLGELRLAVLGFNYHLKEATLLFYQKGQILRKQSGMVPAR